MKVLARRGQYTTSVVPVQRGTYSKEELLVARYPCYQLYIRSPRRRDNAVITPDGLQSANQ